MPPWDALCPPGCVQEELCPRHGVANPSSTCLPSPSSCGHPPSRLPWKEHGSCLYSQMTMLTLGQEHGRNPLCGTKAASAQPLQTAPAGLPRSGSSGPLGQAQDHLAGVITWVSPHVPVTVPLPPNALLAKKRYLKHLSLEQLL